MYAFDEYYDELESTNSINFRNVGLFYGYESQTFCWRNLAHAVSKKKPSPHPFSWKAWWSCIKSYFSSSAKEVETVYYSRFGYISTQSGIVNIISKNGSEFLRTLYGYTSSQTDGIIGQIYYEGCLLSPSEVLTLFSYINHDTWLCDSLTVDEYINNTINLNVPLWV